MKEDKWYKREVAKLLAIVEQDKEEIMIAKTYMAEKLKRILTEVGIGIHPTLIPVVDKIVGKPEPEIKLVVEFADKDKTEIKKVQLVEEIICQDCGCELELTDNDSEENRKMALCPECYEKMIKESDVIDKETHRDDEASVGNI